MVLDAGEEAFVDEAVQSLREDVAADAEGALEVVEAPSAQAGLSDEEQVPVVAEDVGASGDRAGPGRGVGPLPVTRVGRRSCIIERSRLASVP